MYICKYTRNLNNYEEITAIPVLIDGALQLLMAIVDAIPQILPPIIEALPKIIDALITGLTTAIPQLLEGAIQLLMAIIDAIPVIIEALIPQIPTIIGSIVNTLIENEPALLKAASEVMMAIIKAIPQIVIAITKAAPDIIKGLIEGLLNGALEIGKTILTIGKTILDGIKDFFGIHSPSTVMAEIGGYIVEGLINALTTLPTKALAIFSKLKDNGTAWALIVSVPILIIFIVLAFFKISEMWMLEYLAKIFRNKFFDVQKKFQVNYEKNSDTEIAIKEAKVVDTWTQTVEYKKEDIEAGKKLAEQIEKWDII